MAGLNNWKDGWSADKRDWCWENERRGGPSEYDCSGPRYDWSDIQGEWCCSIEGIGCPVTRYRAAGYGSAILAMQKCGDMPMTKNKRQVRHLHVYVEGQVAAGRMSVTGSLWLGGHWYEPRQRWEWNDHTPIGRALLQEYYKPSLPPYIPRLRPFLFLRNGTWHDADADERHDIVCEEPAPAEEELPVV
jgi:hypothetical protein